MSSIVAKFTIPRENSLDLAQKLPDMLTMPAKDGKTFKGWFTIDGKKVDELTASDIKDNVYVFAKYE